jgi:hypothetical protein
MRHGKSAGSNQNPPHDKTRRTENPRDPIKIRRTAKHAARQNPRDPIKIRNTAKHAARQNPRKIKTRRIDEYPKFPLRINYICMQNHEQNSIR